MNAEAKLKTPPAAIESEKTVLGSLLMNQAGFERVEGIIRPEAFYTHTNKEIFSAIAHLSETEGVYDAALVKDHMEKIGAEIDMNYLSDLVDRTLGDENIEHHAHQIRDAGMKRDLLAAVVHVTDKIYGTDPLSAEEAIDFAEGLVLSVGGQNSRRKGGLTHASVSMQQTLEDFEKRKSSGGGLTGLATGRADIDSITGGLQSSDLVIIAGRPSMGKTTLAMNIATNAALKGTPVAVFSMEMSATQLQQRVLASGAMVPLTMIREGTTQAAQDARIFEHAAKISNAPLHIDETGALTPGEVRSRCRKLHKDHKADGGIGLVVIDYLQMMQTDSKGGNRNQEITEISQALKALAKELKIPVIVLSQLNRELEKRPDKRPVMSDLRESGAIEQDADVIAFVYREEVYDKESMWRGTAEILIRKQRQGPTGMVRLAFNGPLVRFEDYTSGDDYQGIEGL